MTEFGISVQTQSLTCTVADESLATCTTEAGFVVFVAMFFSAERAINFSDVELKL